MSHRRRRSYDSNSSYDSSEEDEDVVTYDKDRVRVEHIMEEMVSINNQFNALNCRLYELCEELHTLSHHYHHRSNLSRDDDDENDDNPGLQQQQPSDDDDSSDGSGSSCGVVVLVVGKKEAQYLSSIRNDISTQLQKWSNAYHWIRHCIGLRNNDPAICRTGDKPPPPLPLPTNYGRILSECLQYNTHVTDVTFCMNHLPAIPRPTTNNVMDIPFGFGGMLVADDVRPLLEYIQMSTVLERVTLTGNHSSHTRDMAKMFLTVISRNWNIQGLFCHDLQNIPLEPLSAILSGRVYIQELSLRCENWVSYTPAEQMHFVEAMAWNKSLYNLHLHVVDDDGAMMESILQSSTGSLQTLTIQAAPPSAPFQSLTLFLQRTSVHHLELKDIKLNALNMERIVQGLLQPQSVSSTSTFLISPGVTKLSFDNCEFDDEAATMFISFMQSPVNNDNHSQESDGDDSTISLQELNIKFDEDDLGEHPNYTFGSLPLGHAMALMVIPTTNTNMNLPLNNPIGDRNAISVSAAPSLIRQNRTVGSQLQELSLHPFDCMMASGFGDTVRSNAHVVQISCLRLSQVCHYDWRRLLTWIPYLLSIQELYMSMAEDEKLPEDFLLLLQQSGSIRQISLMGPDGLSLWRSNEPRTVRAFCQRNERLRKLLQCEKQITNHRDCIHEHGNATTGRHSRLLCDADHTCKSDDGDHDTVEDAGCILFPTLLQVAKQVPYTRVSTLLSSLLMVEVVHWMDAHDKLQPASTTSGSSSSSHNIPPVVSNPPNIVVNPLDQQLRKRKKRQQLTRPSK